MGKKVYGYWDCPFCSTSGIRGDNRECPNCGRPRGENTKFYLKEKKEYVSKEKENNNPDWLCSYCQSLNSDKNATCSSCGAVRTSEELNYFDMQNKSSSNTLLEHYEMPRASLQSTEPITPCNSQEPPTTKRIASFFIDNIRKFALGAGILAIIALICFLFIPYEKEITVDSFLWEREITIEELVTCNESGWSLPSGARLQRMSTEIKEYIDVFDHYETKTRQVAKQELVGYETYVSGYRDLGNGQFEEITAKKPIYETYYEEETYQEPVYRKEPVYAKKYYYEIDRWKYKRSVSTKGNDKNPYWGKVILEDKERQDSKNSYYYIFSQGERYKISYSKWESLQTGDTITVKALRFSNVVVSIKE